MVKTGVPDGSQVLPARSKVRNITISGTGDGGSVGDAKSSRYPETNNDRFVAPRQSTENLRKGVFGPPIAPRGVNMSTLEEYTPKAEEPNTDKFGLARGKFGTNTNVGA